MKLLRMTTRRWMIVVVLISAELASLTFLRRLAADRVATFMQKVRDQAGLPPDIPLSDFDVPVPRDVIRWIEFDGFLSRFWIVLLVLIVLSTLVATACFPRGAVRASAPLTKPGER
jgi:hypothetical protein